MFISPRQWRSPHTSSSIRSWTTCSRMVSRSTMVTSWYPRHRATAWCSPRKRCSGIASRERSARLAADVVHVELEAESRQVGHLDESVLRLRRIGEGAVRQCLEQEQPLDEERVRHG